MSNRLDFSRVLSPYSSFSTSFPHLAGRQCYLNVGKRKFALFRFFHRSDAFSTLFAVFCSLLTLPLFFRIFTFVIYAKVKGGQTVTSRRSLSQAGDFIPFLGYIRGKTRREGKY